MCPISYSSKRQRDIRILPMYAATLTQRRWPAKLALEGTVASGVGIPGLSHIQISKIRLE
jgi:hypothetical protein